MTTHSIPPAPSETDRVAERLTRRRGLFALAWAAVMGFVLKYTTEPVEAAASLQFGNVASSSPVENAASGPTRIISQPDYPTTSAVFIAQALSGQALCALQGVSGSRPTIPMQCAIYANQDVASTPSAAILGDDRSGVGVGVLGRSANNSVGVQGESGTAGAGGIGVRGLIANTSTVNAIAVYGLNNSSFTGPGPGAGGFGVYGLSAKGHGLVGATSTAGGAAVVGATNSVPGAYAGAFYGPVIVGGDFTVFGAKSAAVSHPDGSHRRLYCVESPESWFEDFGRATLVCGEAQVTIDRDFAAVVDPADYHVFLTGYDGAADLSVYDRTPQGFRVSAKSGNGESTFSWRVVAKRKDIAGPRFERVEVPREPVLPDLPAAPK